MTAVFSTPIQKAIKTWNKQNNVKLLPIEILISIKLGNPFAQLLTAANPFKIRNYRTMKVK